MTSKTYMWPPPADHAEVVLCGSTQSVPCRIPFFMVKMFNLPVDLCGVGFPNDLYGNECMELNPIHSYPWVMVYEPGESKPICINGSEAIVPFLVDKYRDLIPDGFYSKNPAKAAAMMQKFHHILGSTYRATMYQFVYPLFGLMGECQYDLCKRDFALDIVEQWAKEKDTPFFEGDSPSAADLCWFSLWCGNNWVQDDKFKNLPWRHKDVIDKYPASKRIIEAVGEIAEVKEVLDLAIGDGCPSANLVIATGFFGMLATEFPGNARKFNRSDLACGTHPNFVGQSEQKDEINQPLNL